VTFIRSLNIRKNSAVIGRAISNARFIFLVVLIAMTVAGCASVKDFLGFVTKINISFEASEDLNPNAEGRPSPLVVRMYEFEDVKAFKEADFFSLYDSENETIGKFILAKDEVEIKPDSTHYIKRRTKPKAKYIGILAAYRDLDNAQWRAIIELHEDKTAEVDVYLGSAGVSVSKK